MVLKEAREKTDFFQWNNRLTSDFSTASMKPKNSGVILLIGQKKLLPI